MACATRVIAWAYSPVNPVVVTSFLQAGVWPRLLARQHQVLYVQCDHMQPLASIRHAIHEQFEIPHEQLQTLTLAALLELAVKHLQQQGQSTKLVLILDQFEQFFIRQRYQQDRKAFVEALTHWYQHPEHSVKIMMSVCNDFIGRMYELQNTLGYTLAPNQNFMLTSFESSEAATVFKTIVGIDNIAYEGMLAEALNTDALVSASDGLIAPADLQILAWMVASGDDLEQRCTTLSAMKKTSDTQVLQNLFLQQLLDLCQTEKQRQTVLKVLLGMIDLDNNISAGSLTETELQ